MKRTHFLTVALVSAAALLMATSAAHAQRGGRGGGYHGGYGYRGGFYGPGIGIGIGVYPYGLGYPYPLDPYYVVPRVAYYPPLVAGVEVPAQPAPATPQFQAPQPTTTAAQIRVLVPDPSAKILFDGAMTTQTGTDRLFHTPPLTGEASYRIQARWMQGGKEVAQEVVVPVAPGKMSVADFTKTASEPLPPPAAK